MIKTIYNAKNNETANRIITCNFFASHIYKQSKINFITLFCKKIFIFFIFRKKRANFAKKSAL